MPAVPLRRAAPILLWLFTTLTGGSVAGQPFFTALDSRATGVTFTNPLSAGRALTNQIFLNGAGVAAGDVDGDGKPDLFFAGFSGASALWRNVGGLRFTNITADAGLGALAGLDATGAALADLDGDGSLDLVVNTLGRGTWIFLNDGRGRFTAKPAINPDRGGASLALADVDGDGALDLYVANYRRETVRDDPAAQFRMSGESGHPEVIAYNGRAVTNADLIGRFLVVNGTVREQGEAHALFLNDGHGNFRPIPWNEGAFLDADGRPLSGPFYDWGLSCVFRDLNGDGKPDLYVCNDFESPDRLWLNESAPGRVRFRLAGWRTRPHLPAFSMGVDVADVNRDGFDDFFTADMLSRSHRLRNTQVNGLPPNYALPGVWDDQPQFSMNMLYLANGDGTFSEIARFAGLAASEWSWCPVFLDVDLDGYEDLLVSNGNLRDFMDLDVAEAGAARSAQRKMSPAELLSLREAFPRFNAPKAAFRNRGNLTFEDVSASWGFQLDAVTHGMALADLDGDGDQDLVVNVLQGPAVIFRNDATAPRLAVRLRGRAPNTRGVGARILVRGGPVAEQSQVIQAGGRYLSSDDPLRVFAAGKADRLEVEVRWPSGRRSLLKDVAPNQTLTVEEAATPPERPSSSPPLTPLFEEAPALLPHTDIEAGFDDFARQPLLPRKMSPAGPGAAWVDLNDDGWDDLVLGASAGGRLTVWTNRAGAGFGAATNAVLARTLGRDLTTILPVHTTLLAGSSNYRDGQTNGGLLRVTDLERGASGESLHGLGITSGPVAWADVETNNSLWLFIGGRSAPGRWPEPADSLLVKSDAGRFQPQQRLPRLGNVSAACFADLDGDGADDLVAACDWGPVRIFHNDHGRFVETTAAWGLANFTGWWTSVAVGDFDGDGRLDLVAGNWGWNQFPAVTPADLAAPLPPSGPVRRCWYGDLSGAGGVDLLETYFDEAGREWPVRKADSVLAALPAWRADFPTRAAFGAATAPQLLGTNAARLASVEARWFATTLFLNRGGHFEAKALPSPAQFAPVFGIAVGDFDGDGHQDLFLAQNFFALHRESLRQDAGRGLVLLGDGRGGFTPLSAAASGVALYGEGRAAAVADYDHDGRPDLVVTQSGGPTHLLHNIGGRPGVRVRLAGTASAPLVAGALVQGLVKGVPGPALVIQAGAGYLSVNSPQLVLAGEQRPDHVQVRWPGGGWRKYVVPAQARELTVQYDGSATYQR